MKIRHLFYIAILLISNHVYAQPITVSGISTTGRFNTCGILPTITATFISGTGSTVNNGNIVCLDPRDSTLIHVTVSNIRWNQQPSDDWLHGVFFLSSTGISIRVSNSFPAGWAFNPFGCTGASCSNGTTGGSGYFFAGPGQSCCPGGESTPSPCDNFGDVLETCTTTTLAFDFDIMLQNGILRNAPLLFKIRGTADGNTGCWSMADPYSNLISYQLPISGCIPSGPVLCDPLGLCSLDAGLSGSTYQWQRSTDSINFNNISNNTNYAGVTSNTITLSNIPSTWYGYQFRCVVDGVNGPVYTIKFANTWIGTTNAAWNNPANWSCWAVPDAHTDAIINSGTVIVTASTSVRSLTMGPGVIFTVNPGIIFTVLH